MAKITINEISQDYSYAIGNNSYATVALPITSSWGPGFFPYEVYPSQYNSDQDVLEDLKWQHFSSSSEGLEKFISMYRGATTIASDAMDKSFQTAITLLSAGYDILVCRIGLGHVAEGYPVALRDDGAAVPTVGAGDDISQGFTLPEGYFGSLPLFKVSAMYPGSFGNNISAKIKLVSANSTSVSDTDYINVIVYVETNGSRVAVENSNIYLSDFESYKSAYIRIDEVGAVDTDTQKVAVIGNNAAAVTFELADGDDGYSFISTEGLDGLKASLVARGFATGSTPTHVTSYYDAVLAYAGDNTVSTRFSASFYREWVFSKEGLVLDLLKDRLTYSPDVVMSAWDDQDFKFYKYTVPAVGAETPNTFIAGPQDKKLFEVACQSRCCAAFISAPRSLTRSGVKEYAALLSDAVKDYTNDGLASTHGAMFGPWGRIRYQGTSLMDVAAPSFLGLMEMRSMHLNSPTQYFWALPTNRKVTLNLGEFDYTLSSAYLDSWQAKSGVDVNALVKLPDLGTCIYGNSTLYNVPEAAYNALQNLSTRLMFNELRNYSYRCGLAITFQYNNAQAYSAFYAGMTPILDTMRNVGAIDNYIIKVNAELDELGQVMANSVIGKIYLVVNGVINDLTVDLIALPAGTDLNQFA